MTWEEFTKCVMDEGKKYLELVASVTPIEDANVDEVMEDFGCFIANKYATDPLNLKG